jgi:hypothetical protein
LNSLIHLDEALHAWPTYPGDRRASGMDYASIGLLVIATVVVAMRMRHRRH